MSNPLPDPVDERLALSNVGDFNKVPTNENEPYLIVTPEQLKQGWLELRGVTPIHHNFVVLLQLESGNYVVKAPRMAR